MRAVGGVVAALLVGALSPIVIASTLAIPAAPWASRDAEGRTEASAVMCGSCAARATALHLAAHPESYAA